MAAELVGSKINAIKASFWRGGTSKGLIVRAQLLAGLTQNQRDAVLCAAMGSPDPDGRQIDGLGGGVSSLSKVALIEKPADMACLTAQIAGQPLPGIDWADQIERALHPKSGWDVNYRFGQVPIRSGSIVDWGSTCGNLIAAVACAAVDHGLVDSAIVDLASRRSHGCNEDLTVPVRILTANNGKRVVAYTPVSQTAGGWWRAQTDGDASIAGVPGTAAPIIIETPLLERGALLPTARAVDSVTLPDGATVDVSIVDAGLPVIFVHAADLGLDLSKLAAHPATLDSDIELMQKVEELRRCASQLNDYLASLYFEGSAAPKVCVLHERADYQTTGGQAVKAKDMDCIARAISVGQFHRTIPATTLSALAVAAAFPETLVSGVIRRSHASGPTRTSQPSVPGWVSGIPNTSEANILSVSAGQPAGVSSTCLRVPEAQEDSYAILMERTARNLMTGTIQLPGRVAFEESTQYRKHLDGFVTGEAGQRDHRLGMKTPSPAGQRRGFHTSAVRSASPDSMPVLHLYRNLLRTISRHPNLWSQERKSIRKLFRDDFTAACRESSSVEAVDANVRTSLLLLLAASPRQDSSAGEQNQIALKARGLAQGMLTNISTLDYHHLSPNTCMPSSKIPRLVGGSDTASARSSRSRRSLAPSTSDLVIAAAYGDRDSLSSDGVAGSQRLVAPLATIARPARGPSRSERVSLTPAWDGQRPGRHLEHSVADNIQRLEETLQRLSEDSLKHKPDSKEGKRLAEQMKQVKSMLKGIRKRDRKAKASVALLDEVRWQLMDVVRRAAAVTSDGTGASASATVVSGSKPSHAATQSQELQPASSLLFGQSRWTKWYRREYLPP
ncbi:unnamed protein product [Parajaminaea phylloscopi]